MRSGLAFGSIPVKESEPGLLGANFKLSAPVSNMSLVEFTLEKLSGLLRTPVTAFRSVSL
jgi:hypothetical protein